MNAINNLTPQQLRQAADLQERILALQSQLEHILGFPSGEPAGASGGRRRLSAAGLANIRAGARRRWAKVHASGGAEGNGQRTRKMSAAGRAAISARMKARWAAAKRAGRNAL